jgi:hypothetical protein
MDGNRFNNLTMKIKNLAAIAVATLMLGASAQALTLTYTFLENGSNVGLGQTSTFYENGIGLTAYSSLDENLYAKSSGPGETGLGLESDSDHEIFNGAFVQLVTSSTGLNLDSILLGSVQPGETATVYFSTVLGVLGGQIGTVTSDGFFSLAGYTDGYIGVSAGTGNVLVQTATGHINVPDAGSTALLLGSALAGLSLVRRKFNI